MAKLSSAATRINKCIEHYEATLKELQYSKPLPTSEIIIVSLKARDNLQKEILKLEQDDFDALSRIVELDDTLKRQSTRILQVVNLEKWRGSLLPIPSAWWWFLDVQEQNQRKRHDLMFYLAAGLFLALALPLAVEIIRRFMVGMPDAISIWGTLLTVLLTTGPFLNNGNEAVQDLLNRLPFTRPERQAEIMLIFSTLILIILLTARLWLLPGPLATYYNNMGVAEQSSENLSLAQQAFQRAAALNPDRVVPYYNLAQAYQNAGLNTMAVEMYQDAIVHNSNFTPAYYGLGELFNQQESYVSAERVLLAGLNVHPDNPNATVEKVARYKLLTNLGWSYWAQNKIDLAKTTLESAIAAEAELQVLGNQNQTEFRLAMPHFFLAQIYEGAGDMNKAQQQWEDSLRFLDQNDWTQKEQYQVALQHLQAIQHK